MPNEFSVRLVPAKMAGVVSPRGGGGGGGERGEGGVVFLFRVCGGFTLSRIKVT